MSKLGIVHHQGEQMFGHYTSSLVASAERPYKVHIVSGVNIKNKVICL